MKSFLSSIWTFLNSLFATLWWLAKAAFYIGVIVIVAMVVGKYSEKEENGTFLSFFGSGAMDPGAEETGFGTFSSDEPTTARERNVSSMEIPFIVDYDTKWIHPERIVHVKSLTKDIQVYICEDDDCENEDSFKVKRMSLSKVQYLLEERGMNCFYRLKTDLVNLKYYEREEKEHHGGTVYDYWLILKNNSEVSLPKDRRRAFKEAVVSCSY